jgi:hypothetical protein
MTATQRERAARAVHEGGEPDSGQTDGPRRGDRSARGLSRLAGLRLHDRRNDSYRRRRDREVKVLGRGRCCRSDTFVLHQDRETLPREVVFQASLGQHQQVYKAPDRAINNKRNQGAQDYS